MKMTLGSLFDGIGGWLLAAKHAGIEPLWSSEIEPFPCAVTKHHFPDVVQLGDITKLDGAELWPVDIICAGSPCQDLSVAGKREGLEGARSGLFRTAIRLVRDMRRASGGKYPRFFVWENVPGAFSSNRGADFRAVLEEITESEIPMPPNNKWADAGMVEWDGGSLAWRVLDAQYWGVPQRRKRIFLVASFGTRCAGEILFEQQGLHGNIAESGEAREETAVELESRAGGASGDCLTPWDCQAKRIYKQDGVFPCLQSTESNGEKPGSVYVPDKARSLTARADGSPCVDRGPDVIAAGFKHKASPSAGNIGYKVETAPTLMEGQTSAVAVYDMTHADEVMRKVPDGRAPTLNARMGTGGNQVPVVSYDIAGNTIDRQIQNGGNGKGVLEEKSYTLNTVDRHAVCKQKSVRRLTPLEAERLQGLPEVWEVNIGMMTNDEYIAFNLAAGHIVVDCNTGDVFATRGPGGIVLDTPRKLNGSIVNGYLTYSIRNGAIKKPCRANRIVWISANGVIPDGMVVDHINNDKLDNRLANLQLLSPEDNSHKAKKDGLYLCGAENPSTKLSSDEKIKIFMEYQEGDTSYSKLAEKYKVSKARIAQIIKRDGYTLIDDKTCSDTARYKALGNGMAQPCADYVIKRIVEVTA